MKRAATLVAAVLILAAAGWLALRPRGPRVSPQSAGEARPRAPIDVGVAVIYPEAGGPAVVAVTLVNHVARQAAAANTALDAAADDSPRRPVETIAFDLEPAAWTSAVRFAGGPGAPAIDAAHVRVVRGPSASRHVVAGDQPLRLLFTIGSDGVAALGGRLMAAVSIGEWHAESSVIALAAPADSAARLALRGKAAQAVGDIEGMLAAGDALVSAAPANAWGHWYRGLALEARNDRAGALAAYEAAAARLPPVAEMPEPPVDLFRRIAALR